MADAEPEPDASGCIESDKAGSDALRASLRKDVGEGGLRPECDF